MATGMSGPGSEGVFELYLAMALGLKARRARFRHAVSAEETAGTFVRQLHLRRGDVRAKGSKTAIRGNEAGSWKGAASSPALQGSSTDIQQHRHLVGKGGLMTVGIDSKEDLKLNHMGLPGRRGCGKGNTVCGLEGGGPWLFTIGASLDFSE